MSTSQHAGRGAIDEKRQRIGAGILFIGSVVTLLGLYWLPFKSEDIIRPGDGAVIGIGQSLTEWQVALNDGGIFWILFAFIALVTILALFFGGEEALRGGEELRRLRLRFTKRFLLLFILAFLIQWYLVLEGSFRWGTIDGFQFPSPPCFSYQNICAYTEWRGAYGIWVSLIGLSFLLGYQFIRYVAALPELEMQKHI